MKSLSALQVHRRAILEYIAVIACALLYAFTFILFIIGNKFAPAGVGGIATMVEYKFGFSVAYLTLLINLPLCVYAFFCISRDFAVKTLLFCVVYSAAYLVLQHIDMPALGYIAETDTIFPCLIAGVLSGFVYGICFRINASSGGTDVIARDLSRRRPMLNFFWVTFALNAAVALVSFFVYATPTPEGIRFDYKPVCLCLLYCFTSSYLGNRIMQGARMAYKFFIITDHADEIGAEVLGVLHHGATRLQGKGIYGNHDRDILVCVVNRHQLVDFRNILKKYDRTFAFVETVNETIGNFPKIK